MRVIGYLRVSTAEQAESGAGLDAQRATIQRGTDRRGCPVEWVEDAGWSGASLDRPDIANLLAAPSESTASLSGWLGVAPVRQVRR